MHDAVARLADRHEILDRLGRYARGVDRRDWEAVRSTFFADAVDEHGDFTGTRDEFIDWIRERHATFEKSTHFLGNCVMDFLSDSRAIVETYFIAKLELGPTAGGHREMLAGAEAASGKNLLVTVTGRYADRFEKRDGEWRVARRITIFDFSETTEWGGPQGRPDWPLGLRSSRDPLYRHYEEAGLAPEF